MDINAQSYAIEFDAGVCSKPNTKLANIKPNNKEIYNKSVLLSNPISDEVDKDH